MFKPLAGRQVLSAAAALTLFAATASGVAIAAGALQLSQGGNTTTGCGETRGMTATSTSNSTACTSSYRPRNRIQTDPRTERSSIRFLDHVVRLLAANDYRAAYPLLDPAQRRLFSADEYVACEQMSPIPGTLTSLRVLDSRRERIHVAGASMQRVLSMAVRFELRLTGSLPGEAATVDLTAHAVSVAGRWTWILSARRLTLHRSGTCGIGAN